MKDISSRLAGAPDSKENYQMLQRQVSQYLNDVHSDRVWFVIVGHAASNNPPASTGNEDFAFVPMDGKFSIFVYSIPKEEFNGID